MQRTCGEAVRSEGRTGRGRGLVEKGRLADGDLLALGKKKESPFQNSPLQYPERDLNPHGPFGPTDFKSVVSTNSTIQAGRNRGAI